MLPPQQGAVGQWGRGREGEISDMQDSQQLAQENAALRKRVTVLSAAMLRISASLDVVTVLREIIQGARSLAGARYGVIVTIDKAGRVQDVVTSGFTDDEERQITAWEEGVVLFERLGTQAEALRVNDMPEYVRSLGLADNLILSRSLQAVPMRYGDALVGSFFIAGKEAGPAFTDDDEELLTLFAAQAAVAVTNSRAHRAEIRARADVEALVETSPVGVVVLEAGKAQPLFVNPEASRILGQLHSPGSPIDKVLDELVVRREDGRDLVVSPSSFVVEETVRGEEIALSLPNGRSVPLLISTTPIRSEDGAVRSAVVAMQDIGPLKEMEKRNTQFVSLVSHELRAPLAAIKGSAATVLSAPSGSRQGGDAGVLPRHRRTGRPHARPGCRPARCRAHRGRLPVRGAGAHRACSAPGAGAQDARRPAAETIRCRLICPPACRRSWRIGSALRRCSTTCA